jgi:hypothetical protein
MFRMQVMHQPNQWEEYLPLVYFSYNNGYQESLKTSPFEVLYGRKCIVPISWDSLVEKVTLVLELLKEMKDVMSKIRHNLKASQDRQKNYVDKKRTHKELKVGDHVYLKVKHKRIHSLMMGTCANLKPHY